MNCENKIISGLDFDCNDKPVQGTVSAYMGNLSELNITWANKGSSIGSITGKLFKIDILKSSNASGDVKTVDNEKIGKTYEHSVTIDILNYNIDTISTITDLGNSHVVVFLEVKDKGINSDRGFRVYGGRNGMTGGDFAGGPNAENGIHTLTLKSDAGETEPNPPAILLKDTHEDTKTLLESLLPSSSS